MSDQTDPHRHAARRTLLGDLQSISALLDARELASPEGAVQIPVLLDVVEVPALEADGAPGSAGAAGGVAAPALGREELRDVLGIEAERIVDELMDEYLPQIEARLRERLEVRERELVRASLRERQRGS